MLSNLVVVGEAKKRHRSDMGLPLPYSAQAQTLKSLPVDVQACLCLVVCESASEWGWSLVSCRKA